MTTVPTTSALAGSDVVDAEQLAQLEAAYRLPAVEPAQATRRARRRRAALVADAARAGVTPLELVTTFLFVVLAIGLVALVAMSFVG